MYMNDGNADKEICIHMIMVEIVTCNQDRNCSL